MLNSNLKPKDVNTLYDLLSIIADHKEAKKMLDAIVYAEDNAKRETEVMKEAKVSAEAAIKAMNTEREALDTEKDVFNAKVKSHEEDVSTYKHEKKLFHDTVSVTQDELRAKKAELDGKAVELSEKEAYLKGIESKATSLMSAAQKLEAEYTEKLKKLKDLV